LHRGSKLDEACVLAIREARQRGVPVGALAYAYNVAASVISNIAHGRTWKHVQPE
jgi:hypothetical protein